MEIKSGTEELGFTRAGKVGQHGELLPLSGKIVQPLDGPRHPGGFRQQQGVGFQSEISADAKGHGRCNGLTLTLRLSRFAFGGTKLPRDGGGW